MAKEDVLLLESKDRNQAFAAYDACRRQGGSYLDIELKVIGDTLKVYAVPFYPYEELQPGPRNSYDHSISKLRSLMIGFIQGWDARG